MSVKFDSEVGRARRARRRGVPVECEHGILMDTMARSASTPYLQQEISYCGLTWAVEVVTGEVTSFSGGRPQSWLTVLNE